MRRALAFWLIGLALPFFQLSALLRNLEEPPSSFILETKRLEIPGFPDAFNPSIIPWKDHFLLSFRFRDRVTGSTNKIGLIETTLAFDLSKETPFILEIRQSDPLLKEAVEDARLIMVGDELYVVYNNFAWTPTEPNRRVYIGRLAYQDNAFHLLETFPLLSFEGSIDARKEKNWSPFLWNNSLYLIYSLMPHKILKPILGTNSCITEASSDSTIVWPWGTPRGGTQAWLVEGEYLSFFHSVKSMKTVHSEGKEMPHYFMGAYTFASHPPFNITRVSPKPILGKNFYTGPAYQTWKPLRALFPGGFIADDQWIWVFYGRQDHEMWVVKLDKKGLYESLLPVSSLDLLELPTSHYGDGTRLD